MHFDDDAAQIEPHSEACRSSCPGGIPFEKLFGIGTFESFPVVLYGNLDSVFRSRSAQDDRRTFFVGMFRGVLKQVRHDLLELQAVDFHESEIPRDAVDDADFRMDFRIDSKFFNQELSDLHLLFEQAHRARFVILDGEELGKEVARPDELGIQYFQFFFQTVFRNSRLQIVENSVRLEYGVGYGRFYFVGNDADEFFLPVDEIVVFDGFFVHLFVEVDVHVLQLLVGRHVFQLEPQEKREFPQFGGLFFGVRVGEGLFS